MCIKAESLSVFLPLHLSALAVFRGNMMSRQSSGTVWSLASVHPILLLFPPPPHFHGIPSFFLAPSHVWPQTTCCVPWQKKPFPKFSHNLHVLFCFVFFSPGLKSDNEHHHRCNRSECCCDYNATAVSSIQLNYVIHRHTSNSMLYTAHETSLV